MKYADELKEMIGTQTRGTVKTLYMNKLAGYQKALDDVLALIDAQEISVYPYTNDLRKKIEELR